MSVGIPIPNLGTVSAFGLGSILSFEFTDVSGVQPGIGKVTFAPFGGLPQQDSDVVLGYNGQTVVTIANCHIVDVSYEAGGGGQVGTVRFYDERWAWKSASITGKYNYRLPNNWVDPNHEKTPQELATLCFQAMGVTNFDVSNLPNDLRPEVSWDYSYPHQELDKLCGDMGCRVVCQRSTGQWVICVTGVGQDLPSNFPMQDVGAKIDPKEIPDYIKVVSGPIRYQVFLPLVGVGMDFDRSWQLWKDLSYAPSKWQKKYKNTKSQGFFKAGPSADFGFMSGMDFLIPVTTPTGKSGVKYLFGCDRYTLPDGTKVSAQELANDTIYRCWRVDFTNQPGAKQSPNFGTKKKPITAWGMPIPGINVPVTVEQIILTDKLVQTYTDYLGTQHERPAFIAGEFFGQKCEGDNYPPGTRIDKQAEKSDQNMDDRASFSLSLDPIDTKRSIITTSRPLGLKRNWFDSAMVVDEFEPAKLQICCAIHVRDPVTWQAVRNEYTYQIGKGTNTNFCRIVMKEDIQPWVIGDYDTGSNSFNPKKTTNNYNEVAQQSQYYAQSIANEYTLSTSKTGTCIGFFAIDMDGAIQQVSYSMGPGGASTIASQGTEHSWITPDWEQRRQAVARQGIAGMVEYARYESQRRTALVGRYNT